MRRLAFVLLLGATIVACDKRGRGAAPAGSTSATSASGALGAGRAEPHILRVDAALLDAGRLRTARVSRRTPTGAVRLPADVVASAEGVAEAGTLVPGRVARFEVREGDRVKRGQVLAWLDAPEAAKAMADLLRARARADAQARKVARLETLVSAEATSALAVDEARLELATARADLAAARTVATSFGLAEPSPSNEAPAIVAQVPVRSPAAGIVVERAVALGAHVSPEDKLFRILAEGRVLVDARLADGAPVLPPNGATATVQARGGAPCKGTVVATLPQIDPATRTRKVRIDPDVSCTGLVPGAQADVTVALGAASPDGGAGAVQVVTVPSAAVVEVKSASFVFVALRGGFEARPVDVGARVGDELVVRAGLDEGEEVVVEGAVLLKGELIRGELGGEP